MERKRTAINLPTPAACFRNEVVEALGEIVRAQDPVALEAWLTPARLFDREAATAMDAATDAGWTTGTAMLRAAFPRAAQYTQVQRPDRVATILAEYGNPLVGLAAVLTGPPPAPEASARFFKSPRQLISAAMGLCKQPSREALWRLLQARCPAAALDLAGILAPGATRTQFLKTFAGGWRTGVINADSLDFLAQHVAWPPGATAAVATGWVAAWHNSISQRDGSSQAAWQDFLDRNPARRADFTLDLLVPDNLARLLLALQMHRPEADQADWVDWLSATLPRLPSKGRRLKESKTLYPRLAAAFAQRRLDQPALVLRASARRRA